MNEIKILGYGNIKEISNIEKDILIFFNINKQIIGLNYVLYEKESVYKLKNDFLINFPIQNISKTDLLNFNLIDLNLKNNKELTKSKQLKIEKINLNEYLLISESLLSKAQQEASAMNNKIDLETEKYSKMVEGDEKVKLKTIIEAYIKKHSELEKDVKSLETTYLAQKAQLDKNKEELASLNKEIENAKFATSQIEINDSINKAKGTLSSKDGFSQANQKINALKAEVEQQSLSSKAYDNLGKTKEDILIEEHEREASNINISDEFSKRLSKFQ